MDKFGPIVSGVASLLVAVGVAIVLFKTSDLIANLSKWLGLGKESKQ